MLTNGTTLGQGYLEVQVTKQVKDSTLAKIIDLTYQSAEKKSQSQKFIERFARIYTPLVLLASLLLIIIPVFVMEKPFDLWLMQALTLLIISCPCALVVSTPVSIFSAVGNASRKGIVIKGGRFLEEMGKLKAIAFDKTRTLTRGEPVVTDIIPYNGSTKEGLLACLAGIEELSEHPLAKSIVNKAKEDKLEPHEFEQFEAIRGKGIKGSCNICLDKEHCIGTLRFITQDHEVGQEIIKQVERFEKEGKTTIVATEGKKVAGVIGISDDIREESKPTIDTLLKLKIKPIMLTGDNKSSASYVGEQIGLTDLRAELLPDEKVAEVQKLLKEYKDVAMVGDGVNDAPSLATSSVGIAMGAIGSDVAVENADIALMNNNLKLIPYLITLGKKTDNTIQLNTGMAIMVKFVFLALALMGRSNLTLAIFADVGITMLVVLNSLRLFNFSQKNS